MAEHHRPPSSARFMYCNTFDVNTALNTKRAKCSTKQMIFVVTIFLYFTSLTDCNAHFNTSVDSYTVNSILLSSTSPKPTASAILNASEDDYLDYYDYEEDTNSTGSGHRRQHDNSQLAQVVVYFSVILIALGGILIKYFVTQYETSQIKAQEQLNYHRLQNQI